MAGFTNSPLVKYTKLSPNNSGLRIKAIDTITIHCVAGHSSLEGLGSVFYSTARQASSNYGIDDNGNVGMYCEEKNRSWCTSSSSNDQRAITIEVASDLKAPYKVTDKALAGTIALCIDICKRNNIKKLLWKNDKTLIGQIDKQNMTIHQWFKATACPGEYLLSKMGYIASEVNRILEGSIPPAVKQPEKPTFTLYTVRINTGSLNCRKGPGTNYAVTQQLKRNEVFTIVEEAQGPGASKWGKLKSGAGWISLDFCQRR